MGTIYVWTLALIDIHFKLVNITLTLSIHGSYILNSTIPILFFLCWNARRIIIYVIYQHIYINTHVYTHERGRGKRRGEEEGEGKREEREKEQKRKRKRERQAETECHVIEKSTLTHMLNSQLCINSALLLQRNEIPFRFFFYI